MAVAGRGDEAFGVIEALRPDVALLDVRMAGLSGPALCALLRERHPELETRLVLMSVDGAEFDEVRTMVDGFVAKDRSRREICDKLVQVAQREGSGLRTGSLRRGRAAGGRTRPAACACRSRGSGCSW